MLRKNLIISFIAAIILLVGCNGADKDINIDISSASKNLVENINFEDSLELVDAEIAEIYYEIPKNTEYALYMGSGATAEELAVFKMEDKLKTEEMIKNIKNHIEDQIVQFEDYNNKEIKKLENYVLEIKGNYVVLCITDDIENTKSQIDRYIK